MKILSLSLLLIILLSSCGKDNTLEEATVEKPTPIEETTQETLDTNATGKPYYIGLSEEDANSLARENNTRFRVTTRDGEPQMATMDYVPGRINASVTDGIVVSYDIEG